MRKLFYLLMFLTAMNLAVYAQFTQLWEKKTGDYPWLTTDNTYRGMGYDPVTNRLYVVARAGAPNIYVLDASNGSVIDTLDVTGVSGGIFALNVVKVAGDGAIYACNLVTAAGAGFKVYRWANKDAVPVAVVDGNGSVNGRTGDCFNVVGSGLGTQIYASGTAHTAIEVFTTTDGNTFTLTREVPLSQAGSANGSVSPIDNTVNSELWIKGAGTSAMRIDQSGNILGSINGGVVPTGWRNLIYFTKGTYKFVAFAGRNDATEGNTMKVWDVTRSNSFPTPVGEAKLTGAFNTNLNATADLCYRDNNDGTVTLFQLVTNNGIAAWKANIMGYFVVDMRDKATSGDFVPGVDPVLVRGSFNGWGTGDTLRDSDNDSVYTGLVSLGTTGAKEFKFYYRKVAAATDVWEPDPNRTFNADIFYTYVNGGKFGSNMSTDSIGWCNLQWPPSATINAGETMTAYAQIWVNNVTPAPGANARVKAWIGYSSTNNNPSNTNWTWTTAPYNVQVGNNDEYMLTFGSNLPAGTYYYASRFQLDNGPYKYGGYSAGGGGFWDGTTFVSGTLIINPVGGPLSGDYYIPKGSNAKGFQTLAEAFKALDSLGASAAVNFIIDANLTEVGANLVLNRADLTANTRLTIKPNTGKNPVISIGGCTTASGASQYAGMTFNSASFVTIDGSNNNTTTKNLTIAMDDTANNKANGRILINFFGNTDNVVVKNTIIKFTNIDPTNASTRGIYFNGQAVGVADSAVIENNTIGDDINPPFYAISVTGYSTSTSYCSKVYVRNNMLMGKMRILYFFYVGTSGGYCEISGNELKGTKPPITGNVVWGVLLNTYGGRIDFFRNKLQTLRDTTNSTSGLYGFGTLSSQAGTELNIYNNFLGGDFEHTGVGIPASVDVVSFQDNVTAKVYYNTIVLNDMTATSGTRMTGIRFGGTSNIDIKNNIIVNNKNVATAFGIWAGVSTFSSDYNNIYVSGANANIGYFNAARKTMQEWRDSTGKDANSINVIAPFTSALDFHIPNGTTTLLESGATPIAWITTDIDGNTRNATTPDIGADEFNGIRPVPVVVDTVTFAVKELWNMVSVPVQATSMSKTSLFPTANSSAYGYNGTSYVVKDTLERGNGYWLKFPADANVTIIGNRNTTLNIPVVSGWNFIGAQYKNVLASTVTSTPSGIITSPFFGFNNYYYSATTLEKGKGFWVKTSSAGTLTITATATKANPDYYVETIDSKSKYLTIADAAGRIFKLYISSNFDASRYDLPPVPPAGAFDVRFASNKYVESDGKSQVININSAVYPLTITLNNSYEGNYRIRDIANGTIINSSIVNGQAITLNKEVSSFIFEPVNIPAGFDMQQNYPNPFNPSTTVKYSLAENSFVTLDVYNSLGEKVTSLVNKQQDAGYYTVEFNGKDFPSGVYYIRISAGKFNKTVKALLVK